MFAEAHYPDTLAPHQLDVYLAKGWFRMRQTIFTTNFLRFGDRVYSALWLRIQLPEYQPDTVLQRLLRRNAGFTVSIGPALVDEAREELYIRYRSSLTFEPMTSLQQLLYGQAQVNIYNTWEVTVRDGDRLIGIGYFDVGADSAAGIVSVYDPEYKKFSLGKYIIACKIDFCRRRGMRFFYPGYFAPGYPAFDYKLSIGYEQMEYLELRSAQWRPISSFVEDIVPVTRMLDQLHALQHLLEEMNIASAVVKYQFFDANLYPELRGAELFDYPLMLLCRDMPDTDLLPVLVYDVRTFRYKVMECYPVYVSQLVDDDPESYSSHVLKAVQEGFSSPDAEEVAQLLLRIIRPTS